MMMMMMTKIFTYGTNTYRYSFRRCSVRTPSKNVVLLEVEIAGGKVFVTTCGAMNVEWRCARSRGSPAEMVLQEVASTKPCSEPEMRRGRSSGFTLFIITRAGRT